MDSTLAMTADMVDHLATIDRRSVNASATRIVNESANGLQLPTSDPAMTDIRAIDHNHLRLALSIIVQAEKCDIIVQLTNNEAC